MSAKPRRLSTPPQQVAVTVYVDNEVIVAYPGETVASVLIVSGREVFFQPEETYSSSRLYCNMGTCMQCLVTINQRPRRRACQTYIEPDMRIETHS
jgi:hydrogen cyanide synthase HcnA